MMEMFSEEVILVVLWLLQAFKQRWHKDMTLYLLILYSDQAQAIMQSLSHSLSLSE
jgi:hypothetical protein